MPNRVSLEVGNVDKTLQGVENVLNAIERKTVFINAVKAVAKVVKAAAQTTVTQPGYRDKPGFKPLRSTIGIKTKEYLDVVLGIAGPKWPAGAHGHNVEFGHRIVLKNGQVVGVAKEQLYMQRAIDSTAATHQATFEGAVGPAIERQFEN